MATSGTDLQESLALYIRTLTGTGITFSAQGSPYYKRVPDNAPVPPYPYCVFDIPPSAGPDEMFEGGYQEDYEGIAVKIVGTEQNRGLFTPYTSTNLFYQLDALMNSPSALSGSSFRVNMWFPGPYEVDYDNEHAPTGEIVLIATRIYKARVLFNGLG